MSNAKFKVAIETKNELFKKTLDFIEKIKNDFADEQIKNANIGGIVDVSVVINFKSGLRITMRNRFNEDGSMCYEDYDASNINTHEANVIHSYNELIRRMKSSPYKVSYTRKI